MQENQVDLYLHKLQNPPVLQTQFCHDASKIVRNAIAINRVDQDSSADGQIWQETNNTSAEMSTVRGPPMGTEVIRTFPTLRCLTFSSSTLVSYMWPTISMIQHVLWPLLYAISGLRFITLASYTSLALRCMH